ncbi:hypothetical protein LMG32289_03943 [Cupriavidus pampae]|uniref:P-type conjugative transfer protein TrbG n=1 Tax=Cupriavidus pampae TaxID=659251 RepID=A0ABN7YZY8_9BURK|nr:hypothetical protein LMG32289_03943 [Cupriavidus pampae]
MQQGKKPTRLGLMPALLMALLTGCAGVSPSYSSLPAPPPKILPLPAAARQPTIPSECLPTCSKGLTVERESWLSTPTPLASPARPVNEATIP